MNPLPGQKKMPVVEWGECEDEMVKIYTINLQGELKWEKRGGKMVVVVVHCQAAFSAHVACLLGQNFHEPSTGKSRFVSASAMITIYSQSDPVIFIPLSLLAGEFSQVGLS